LKAYGITKPTSTDPAAEKKAEQRAAEKAKILEDFKGVKPDAIKEIIKDAYAKLAASVPDSTEVKKNLKKAETALRLITADEVEAFKKQKAALVSSLNEAIKKCDNLKKLTDALKALK
jgi:DNA polymerase III alpha subunit